MFFRMFAKSKQGVASFKCESSITYRSGELNPVQKGGAFRLLLKVCTNIVGIAVPHLAPNCFGLTIRSNLDSGAF